VCNKVGTYLKALAAKDNGVPMFCPPVYRAARQGQRCTARCADCGHRRLQGRSAVVVVVVVVVVVAGV
jgi:hypothetical protein